MAALAKAARPSLAWMFKIAMSCNWSHVSASTPGDLCRKFMDTGKGNRGQTCPNAHGEHEIGKLAFVLFDKVKLTICQAWTKGKCSYGANLPPAEGPSHPGRLV